MKQIILLFMVFLLNFSVKAQERVNFFLNSQGQFLTSENQDFRVVAYEGLTAEEIYKNLQLNINSIYNDPKIIVSKVDNASLKIRAYCPDALLVSIGGMLEVSASVNYQLEFQMKDGRVRVSAPFIEDEMARSENGHMNLHML